MPVPAAEIARRRARLAEALDARKLDAFFAMRPEDVRYWSGYAGTDAWLLLARERAWLITDFRFLEEAARTARAVEVVQWKRSPFREAAGLAAAHRLRRAAFRDDLTYASYLELTGPPETRAPKTQWRVERALPDELRAVKSPWELGRMAAAQKIAETAFLDLRAVVKPGMQERDVALELDMRMRRLGAEDVAFPTIAAADRNASLPHARPGGRAVKAGGVLLLDFGARVDGYCSDTTRTIFLGEPSARWRERYQWVLDAQEAALAALGPGEGGRRAAVAAAESFAARGEDVVKLFGHGLGHGVGLAVHEAPRLAGATAALAFARDGEAPPRPAIRRGSRKGEPDATPRPAPPPLLAPGHVVTVEPGLYWPGAGGIRIEDMAVVTPAGHRNLTHLPKAFSDVIWLA